MTVLQTQDFYDSESVTSKGEKTNMGKIIEKPSDMVWRDNKTGAMKKGADCPFTSGVLVASIGDEAPTIAKAKPKTENKAVKPKDTEDK
tara:strand:- start:7513 stop:7779 length:267 start_codon:yes stop_codon:yes gene_type:complete